MAVILHARVSHTWQIISAKFFPLATIHPLRTDVQTTNISKNTNLATRERMSTHLCRVIWLFCHMVCF